jgi:hypothetical protein
MPDTVYLNEENGDLWLVTKDAYGKTKILALEPVPPADFKSDDEDFIDYANRNFKVLK